ncbi:MAG: fibronectin type III domain-containing protein [Streptosporangiaceae bacterium]
MQVSATRPEPGGQLSADPGRRRSWWNALGGPCLAVVLLSWHISLAASVLPPPSGLTATAAGGSQVNLKWTAPKQGKLILLGYKIYEGTSPGGESTSPVNNSPLPATSYAISGLTGGTEYYFQVTAVYQNCVGCNPIESSPSNEATATPPPAPSGLLAAASGSQATLTWSPPRPYSLKFLGYNIYVGTSPGGESPLPVNKSLLADTSYAVTGLTGGTTYYFDVTAVYADCFESCQDIESSPADEAHAATPPGAPARLTATAKGSGVQLSWSAPPPSRLTLNGYDIYQGTSPGGESLSPVNSSPLTGTSYAVTGLTGGTTYYFDVTAVTSSGESPPSNEASAAVGPPPPLGTPTGLTATALDSSRVQLSWSAPSLSSLTLVGYNIYEGASQGGESVAPVNSSPLTGTSYAVTGLAGGTTYYFDVTAVTSGGESQPSNEAHATPGIIVRLRPQLIRFGPLTGQAVGRRFTVSASATSGLPVSFSSSTPRVCTVSGSAVKAVASGRCTIQAAQSGDANYLPAAAVTQSFTVSQSPGLATSLWRALITMAVVALAALSAALVLRKRWLRSRPQRALLPTVRAEPHPGPPATTRVRNTGTVETQRVRIEPHAGHTETRLEEIPR